MILQDIVIGMILMVVLLTGMVSYYKSYTTSVYKNNNKEIVIKENIINNAVKNYCQDDNYDNQPSMDDLFDSGYLSSYFDNDSGYGYEFNLSWNDNKKEYNITTYIKNDIALKDFINNRTNRIFGTIPSCITDKSSDDYGKCSVPVNLGFECH